MKKKETPAAHHEWQGFSCACFYGLRDLVFIFK